MKTQKTNPKEGSALIISFLLAMVALVIAATAIKLTSNELRLSKDSSVESQTLHTAEAGIEVGMQAFRQQALHYNGWTNWTGTGNVKTLALTALPGADAGYTVRCDTNNMTITAVGQKLSAVFNENAVRTVEVIIEPVWHQIFENAMTGKGVIDLRGTTGIDSFNSTDPTLSTTGQYDAAKSHDEAVVGSLSWDDPAIDATGNAYIDGDLSVTEGQNIAIGGSFTINGTADDNFDTDVPDVIVPIPTIVTHPRINNTDTILVAGGGTMDMSVPSIALNGAKILTFQGEGTIRIYVEGSTTFGGASQLNIIADPVGADLNVEIYANGAVTLNNVANQPGYAKYLGIFGTENCDNIHFTGADDFIGTIYAPYAHVILSGSGDFMGAIVGDTIAAQGNAGFHWDASLSTNEAPVIIGYEVISWIEL